MILTQQDLDYFNDKRNYKAHFCHYLGCGCPANGVRWREYDEWVRLGRPYTMDEVISEKYVKIVKKPNYSKYVLGIFLMTFFIFFVTYITNKI